VIDLHTHSIFADGVFTHRDVIECAIQRNVKILGVSDHYNTRKTHSLAPEQLENYIDQVHSLKSVYKQRIDLRCGIEIDALDLILSGNSLPDKTLLNRLDYILFEYVTDKPLEGMPLNYLIRLRSQIPVATFLAHTDLIEAFPRTSGEELLKKLEDNSIGIELNESYIRPSESYPYYMHSQVLFEMARGRNLLFLTGSDMHDDLQSLGARAAFDFLESLGLRKQIFLFSDLASLQLKQN
jgi:histidinol phosphatase-like PHP family hydrolase